LEVAEREAAGREAEERAEVLRALLAEVAQRRGVQLKLRSWR
jgi:hypothetical protein